MLPPLLATLSWPLVGLVLFHRLERRLAILVTLVAGFLLLPENTALDLPALPALDKHSVPALTVLLGLWMTSGRTGTGEGLAGLLPKSRLVLVLLAAAVVGAFMTVVTNGDTLVYGPTVLRGLRLYDAFSSVLSTIMMLLPFLIARKYLSGPDSHILILKVLCIAGLAYSFLALYEIRMSPQLNNMVYGFFPHSWLQHVRAGGFRPLVFLQHGLLLAIFFCFTIIAAVGLSRIIKTRRGLYMVVAIWLLGTLVLSNSLGALMITLALFPVILLLNIRLQFLIAAAIAGLILLYPVARGIGVIPLDWIEQMAAQIDADRAGSFRFRLENEDILLAKAQERPLFGWGGWSRSQVFDESGRDISITDGYWVIIIGVGGWVRYIGIFGLLALPMIIMFFNKSRYRIGPESAVLALILAANLVDLIPNSSAGPLGWIFAGALWGRLELRSRVGVDAIEGISQKDSLPRASPGYRRQPVADTIPSSQPEPEETIKSPYSRQKERITRSRPKSD